MMSVTTGYVGFLTAPGAMCDYAISVDAVPADRDHGFEWYCAG